MEESTVRRGIASDAPALARLTSQLGYPATEDSIQPRLARILQSPSDCLLVVEIPGTGVVGWVHGFLCQLLESGYRVEIGGLVVDERWQRRGLGRHLVRALERWAADRGAAELSVRCRTERADAHRFYEGLLFRHSKTQRVFRKQIGEPSARPAATPGSDGLRG